MYVLLYFICIGILMNENYHHNQLLQLLFSYFQTNML